MGSVMTELGGPAQVAYFILVLVACTGSWTFPILYATYAPWRSSESGQHVMWFSVVVAVALTQYIPRLLLGSYPGREIVSFAVIIGAGIVTWWRVSLFIRAPKSKPSFIRRDSRK